MNSLLLRRPVRGWGLLVALALAACSPADTPTAQIQARLAGIGQAVEDRNPGDIQAALAPDFAGPGGMDRAQAQAYASMLLARHRDPRVRWDLQELVIHGPKRATTRLAVSIGAGSGLPALPGLAREMEVELGWKRVEGDWQVVSANWQPAPRR